MIYNDLPQFHSALGTNKHYSVRTKKITLFLLVRTRASNKNEIDIYTKTIMLLSHLDFNFSQFNYDEKKSERKWTQISPSQNIKGESLCGSKRGKKDFFHNTNSVAAVSAEYCIFLDKKQKESKWEEKIERNFTRNGNSSACCLLIRPYTITLCVWLMNHWTLI